MNTRSLDNDVPSPLLTSEHAGKYLQLHRRTLANMRSQGRGPRYVRSGTRALYRKVDLDAWLDEHTFAHTAEERARRINRDWIGQ